MNLFLHKSRLFEGEWGRRRKWVMPVIRYRKSEDSDDGVYKSSYRKDGIYGRSNTKIFRILFFLQIFRFLSTIGAGHSSLEDAKACSAAICWKPCSLNSGDWLTASTSIEDFFFKFFLQVLNAHSKEVARNTKRAASFSSNVFRLSGKWDRIYDI